MPRKHAHDSLRPVEIRIGFLENRAASVLYSCGRTKVLCVASIESGVPPWLEGRGKGWATAEYDMLPGATVPRNTRERGGKISGRTQEIQRLIGRSLRGVLDLQKLDGWTLRVDCDVLQADGGTRTTSINGAFLATCLAVNDALKVGKLDASPIRDQLGAISVGLVGGASLLDLDYEEDSSADVDLNVVQEGSGKFLEIQGTAEGAAYSRQDLDRLLDLAERGIREILEVGRRTLAAAGA
jgi:ribonuclease PH